MFEEIKKDLDELIVRLESDFPLYQITPLAKKVHSAFSELVDGAGEYLYREEKEVKKVAKDVKEKVEKIEDKVKEIVDGDSTTTSDSNADGANETKPTKEKKTPVAPAE